MLNYIELPTFFKEMISAEYEMFFENQLSLPFSPPQN
jgi:hypothetical protein